LCRTVRKSSSLLKYSIAANEVVLDTLAHDEYEAPTSEQHQSTSLKAFDG